MNTAPFACLDALEALSLRLDDELDGARARALDAHLVLCVECRAHARTLAEIGQGWAALRAVAPPPELGARLAHRAPRRRPTPVLLRVAAALIGFLGLGALVRALVAPPAAGDGHLFERLAVRGQPDEFFAAIPEYQLLRRSGAEDER